MVDVRSAQHFTFTLAEAIDALVMKLRASGVVVRPVERAHLTVDNTTSTVQLLVINPITSGGDGGAN